jgi:hypothetical protein
LHEVGFFGAVGRGRELRHLHPSIDGLDFGVFHARRIVVDEISGPESGKGKFKDLHGSDPFHLEQETVLIRSTKDDPIAIPFDIAFADDDIAVCVLLCGIHVWFSGSGHGDQ